jgi:hypothetical protein
VTAPPVFAMMKAGCLGHFTKPLPGYMVPRLAFAAA